MSKHEFKVGGSVEVTNTGFSYSTYQTWDGMEGIDGFIYGFNANEGDKGVIVSVCKHNTNSANLLGVRLGNSKVIIIDEAGVKLINKYPNPPRKHVKKMIAFAEGANVRGRKEIDDNWQTFTPSATMAWLDTWEYEIVPQKTAKESEIERIELALREQADITAKLADDLKAAKQL